MNVPTDTVGENGIQGPPKWRWTVSLAYALDPFTATLAARGISSGTLDNILVECTSNCPLSTINNPTIDNNRLPAPKKGTDLFVL